MVNVTPISSEELKETLGFNVPKRSNPFAKMGISDKDIENTPDSVMNALDIATAYIIQASTKMWEIKTTATKAGIAHKFVVSKTVKDTGKTYTVDLLEKGSTSANKGKWFATSASSRCRSAYNTAIGSEFKLQFATPEYDEKYNEVYQHLTRASINSENGGNKD